MKFFVDTADVAEIKELAALGLLDGVTTNPSLVAKAGRDFKALIAEICEIVPGPVSAEVAATDYEGMLQRGPDARQDRQERDRQGAADLGRPQGLPHADGRRHHGQRDAVFLRQPGAAGGQGRRDVHLAIRRPSRRHQP